MKLLKVIPMFLLMMVMAACNSEEVYEYQLDINGVYEISEELTIEKIDEGVMNVNHEFPWDANSLMIEMKNSDMILIDTPYTYDATKELVEWLQDMVGKDRNIFAINTGFHFDNLGGNKYLKEQGIEIYGTSRTVELIHEKGEESRELFLNWLKAPENKKYYDVYMDLEYIEPTEILKLKTDEEEILNFGNESLILYYPGESHSPDNIVVYYPEKRILFGGCMVKELNATNLGNTADANLEEWSTSLERLKEKYNETNVKYLIPGHGDIGNIQLLDNTLDLFK